MAFSLKCMSSSSIHGSEVPPAASERLGDPTCWAARSDENGSPVQGRGTSQLPGLLKRKNSWKGCRNHVFARFTTIETGKPLVFYHQTSKFLISSNLSVLRDAMTLVRIPISIPWCRESHFPIILPWPSMAIASSVSPDPPHMVKSMVKSPRKPLTNPKPPDITWEFSEWFPIGLWFPIMDFDSLLWILIPYWIMFRIETSLDSEQRAWNWCCEGVISKHSRKWNPAPLWGHLIFTLCTPKSGYEEAATQHDDCCHRTYMGCIWEVGSLFFRKTAMNRFHTWFHTMFHLVACQHMSTYVNICQLGCTLKKVFLRTPCAKAQKGSPKSTDPMVIVRHGEIQDLMGWRCSSILITNN